MKCENFPVNYSWTWNYVSRVCAINPGDYCSRDRAYIQKTSKEGGCGDFDVLETNGKKIKSEVYVYVL